jgi:Asp-tRNA(Asn)/Glu-tRNA(Gln) amidotransferase A subunit family amidase
MARTVRDCALLLHAMLGRDALPELLTLGDGSRQSLTGKRIALSPRMGLVAIDPDVAEGVENAVAAARKLGATIVDPPPPPTALDLNQLFNDIATTDFLAWHAPLLATKRELYRKSTLDLFTYAESQAMTAVEYADGQWQRMESTWAWTDWLEAQRIDAILEPTVPIVASPRRYSHDDVASDDESGARIALTYIWDVTGFPVVSMPSGLGKRSRLPVGVSLVAAAGRELPLLDMGIALQEELGVPEPPTRSEPRPATVL